MSAIRGVNVGGNLFDVTDSSNVAPIELTNFATRNYAKDRCFIMIDGLLYRAMVAISSGDPIVINGNAKRTTLDEMFSVVETDSDLIAPTEDGATSSDDYVIGAQIVRSGILYKVIDDITEGDAFVVGNNIQLAGSVSEQIGSIDEALTNEASTVTDSGAHNFLPLTSPTTVENGVTFTITDTLTISGTPTTGTYSSIRLTEKHRIDVALKGKACKLRYRSVQSDAYYYLWIKCYNSSDTEIMSVTLQNIDEEFTIPSDTITFTVGISVLSQYSGATRDIKPMLILATDPNPDVFTPYSKSNRELLNDQTIIELKIVNYNGLSFQFSKRNGVVTLLIASGTLTNALAINDVLVEVPNGFKPSLEVQSMFTAGPDGRYYYVNNVGAFKTGVSASAGVALRGTITYVSAQ